MPCVWLLQREQHEPGVPDEADMHAQGAVDAGTCQAYVHPIGHRGPGGVLGGAVEADLRTDRPRG